MVQLKARDYIKPEEKISVYSYMAYGTEPEHSHDFFELVYVKSGSGSHGLNGTYIDIGRGDLFFLNIGQSHTFKSKEGMELVNILLQPQFISEELIQSENALEILGLSLFEEFEGVVDKLFSHISFRGEDLLQIEKIIGEMVKECAQKQTGYKTALKGYMEVLLTNIFRRMKTMPADGMLQHIDRISPGLLKYIEENCFENITLKELAQKSFYNPSYFSTVFKAVCGKTLSEFIHEKRIQEAVRLLRESDDSVENICMRVGYRDKKRFYQLFKQQTGTTPGELRTKSKIVLCERREYMAVEENSKITGNYVYIASCVENGGIYRYSLDNYGQLKLVDKINADRVMYMTIHEDTLYAVLKEPFPQSKESGIVSFKINSDGSLNPRGNIISTRGEVACHLAVSVPEKDVYCANYTSGSVFMSDGTLVTHSGNGPDKLRQEAPHTHCTVFTPDDKYLCVVDLGIDSIILYDKALKPVSRCSLVPGSGPRHLLFSPNGKNAFCINELSNRVSVLEYDDGKLIYVDSFYALPKGYSGESYASAIRISGDGKYLYTSNRGHDSISCFEIGDRTLKLFDIVPCGGNWPRDFNINPEGKWLLCANERSNNVTRLSVGDNGKLEKTSFSIELQSPLCVTFR